jgi:hypothetical protein
MLTFIDHRLHILEQVHDQFMGGLNVIMNVIFTKFILFELHAFKNKTNQFNILDVKHYELKKSNDTK